MTSSISRVKSDMCCRIYDDQQQIDSHDILFVFNEHNLITLKIDIKACV